MRWEVWEVCLDAGVVRERGRTPHRQGQMMGGGGRWVQLQGVAGGAGRAGVRQESRRCPAPGESGRHGARDAIECGDRPGLRDVRGGRAVVLPVSGVGCRWSR